MSEVIKRIKALADTEHLNDQTVCDGFYIDFIQFHSK